jgi:hypothetical protein
VWDYTPRQIVGYLRCHERRRRARQAETLAIMTLGSRGDPKEVEKRMRELLRDA